jgi:hypothetical protein
MRASRSSVMGWLDRMDRLLSACFPVTRSSNCPIGIGDRPSFVITSIAKLSAFRSASENFSVSAFAAPRRDPH